MLLAATLLTPLFNWWRDFCALISKEWAHMTPDRYGIILICIGLFGWILMHTSFKK